MISDYGYPIEVHTYTTDDGYINTLHRIPNKSKGSRAVFLQHGLLGTSADFVMGSPEKSLGGSMGSRVRSITL
jgi:lysosomal acid lipase/cholesteryl ester hydrolase